MTVTHSASTIRRIAGTVLVVGVLAGCGGGGSGSYSTPAPASPAPSSAPMTTPASPALNVQMAESPLGTILVDGRGMTLYMFTRDSANTSACQGQCLVNWPPLLGEPTQGNGVDAAKLGSFTRTDGRVQATYNNWPLYYWAGDTKPGDTTGQGVQGVWFVLDRNGEPIK